ncbi:unnamed protein product [Arctogadus glacialis]
MVEMALHSGLWRVCFVAGPSSVSSGQARSAHQEDPSLLGSSREITLLSSVTSPPSSYWRAPPPGRGKSTLLGVAESVSILLKIGHSAAAIAHRVPPAGGGRSPSWGGPLSSTTRSSHQVPVNRSNPPPVGRRVACRSRTRGPPVRGAGECRAGQRGSWPRGLSGGLSGVPGRPSRLEQFDAL